MGTNIYTQAGLCKKSSCFFGKHKCGLIFIYFFSVSFMVSIGICGLFQCSLGHIQNQGCFNSSY